MGQGSQTGAQEVMKVVYCAYGAPKFADQLIQSLRSLRQHHPQARVVVHTVPDFAPYLSGLSVETVVQDVEPRPGDWHDPCMKVRAIKTETEACEPFVYLDNDTYVAGALTPAWELLARFDCMGVQSPIFDQRAFLKLPPAPDLTRPAPEAFPEWNGGVLFFAATAGARRIATRWLQVLQLGIPGGGDQWPLALALWDSGAGLHTLPANYNCRLPACPQVFGAVRILHADHPDLGSVARRLNAQTGLRQVVQVEGGYDVALGANNGQRCF